MLNPLGGLSAALTVGQSIPRFIVFCQLSSGKSINLVQESINLTGEYSTRSTASVENLAELWRSLFVDYGDRQ